MEYREFGNYLVYENGDVYSKYRNKMLRKSIVQGYVQYTLYENGKIKRYKAHRLVAMLFLQKPENVNWDIINHIDGNKLNNHYSNLEWCDYLHNNKHARDSGLNNISKSNHERWLNDDFRERTARNISAGALKSGSNSGHNNGRFRYMIIDEFGNEHTRQELCKELNLSQSYVDALIHKASHSENVPQFISNKLKIIDTKQ